MTVITPEMMHKRATVNLSLYEWFQVLAACAGKARDMGDHVEAKRLDNVAKEIEKQLSQRQEMKLKRV